MSNNYYGLFASSGPVDNCDAASDLTTVLLPDGSMSLINQRDEDEERRLAIRAERELQAERNMLLDAWYFEDTHLPLIDDTQFSTLPIMDLRAMFGEPAEDFEIDHGDRPADVDRIIQNTLRQQDSDFLPFDQSSSPGLGSASQTERRVNELFELDPTYRYSRMPERVIPLGEQPPSRANTPSEYMNIPNSTNLDANTVHDHIQNIQKVQKTNTSYHTEKENIPPDAVRFMHEMNSPDPDPEYPAVFDDNLTEDNFIPDGVEPIGMSTRRKNRENRSGDQQHQIDQQQRNELQNRQKKYGGIKNKSVQLSNTKNAKNQRKHLDDKGKGTRVQSKGKRFEDVSLIRKSIHRLPCWILPSGRIAWTVPSGRFTIGLEDPASLIMQHDENGDIIPSKDISARYDEWPPSVEVLTREIERLAPNMMADDCLVTMMYSEDVFGQDDPTIGTIKISVDEGRVDTSVVMSDVIGGHAVVTAEVNAASEDVMASAPLLSSGSSVSNCTIIFNTF